MILDTVINNSFGGEKKRDSYQSYVFIDTEFKRKSQPIFMLAVYESVRHMQLDSDIQLLPIHEQVVYVQSLVKAHDANCNGSLELWGNIQRYVFYYAKGCVLTLNGDGVILQENPTVNISCATLSVNNQDVMNLFIKK